MTTIPNNEFFAHIESMIADGQSVKITVQGTSMRPFFHSGKDVVVLSPKKTLHRGDIVLFRYEGSYRLHRIIHIWGTLLYIRGDGCYSPFERATTSDVVAVVTSGTYNGGHAFKATSLRWKMKGMLWSCSYWLRSILFRAYQQWKRFLVRL